MEKKTSKRLPKSTKELRDPNILKSGHITKLSGNKYVVVKKGKQGTHVYVKANKEDIKCDKDLKRNIYDMIKEVKSKKKNKRIKTYPQAFAVAYSKTATKHPKCKLVFREQKTKKRYNSNQKGGVFGITLKNKFNNPFKKNNKKIQKKILDKLIRKGIINDFDCKIITQKKKKIDKLLSGGDLNQQLQQLIIQQQQLTQQLQPYQQPNKQQQQQQSQQQPNKQLQQLQQQQLQPNKQLQQQPNKQLQQHQYQQLPQQTQQTQLKEKQQNQQQQQKQNFNNMYSKFLTNLKEKKQDYDITEYLQNINKLITRCNKNILENKQNITNKYFQITYNNSAYIISLSSSLNSNIDNTSKNKKYFQELYKYVKSF